MTVLNRNTLAAIDAATHTTRRENCDTCTQGLPGHTSAPPWHGLPCFTCDCLGAFWDVPEAWTKPLNQLRNNDDREAS